MAPRLTTSVSPPARRLCNRSFSVCLIGSTLAFEFSMYIFVILVTGNIHYRFSLYKRNLISGNLIFKISLFVKYFHTTLKFNMSQSTNYDDVPYLGQHSRNTDTYTSNFAPLPFYKPYRPASFTIILYPHLSSKSTRPAPLYDHSD